MSISIVDVVRYRYPSQFEIGNVAFDYDENSNIIISYWNVFGTPQPSEAYLESLFPQYTLRYENESAENDYLAAVQNLLDRTAQSKSYTNALACLSYFNSTNTTWQAEASAFNSWRDGVYAYTYNIINDINAGTITAPTLSDFMAGISLIVWPS